MSVHTEDKDVEVCLKEREISYLVGIIIIESLFYTISVTSVHTEDKEVQGLLEWKKKLHSSWNESFYTIQVLNVHTEDKEVQGVWCCLKERESSYL